MELYSINSAATNITKFPPQHTFLYDTKFWHSDNFFSCPQKWFENRLKYLCFPRLICEINGVYNHPDRNYLNEKKSESEKMLLTARFIHLYKISLQTKADNGITVSCLPLIWEVRTIRLQIIFWNFLHISCRWPYEVFLISHNKLFPHLFRTLSNLQIRCEAFSGS